jgi:16S rRNA (guanine527-N7)-methyltransferase
VWYANWWSDPTSQNHLGLRQRPRTNDHQPIFYNHYFMETSRIPGLLAPFLDHVPLRPAQLEQISTYIDLLARWNARVNLTAIRTPDEIVTRHFGESFFAARRLFPCGADTPVRQAGSQPPNPLDSPNPSNTPAPAPQARPLLLDLGSGAGFPGLPIKIWSPDTPVTLIESNNKKVVFLREAIRALTLSGIDVSAVRAEHLPDALAGIVTLRAVEHFDQILPTALRLLAPSGRLALLISESQLKETKHLCPTLHWSDPKPIPNSKSRILAVGSRT